MFRRFHPVDIIMNLLVWAFVTLIRVIIPALFEIAVWATWGVLAAATHVTGRALMNGEIILLSGVGWGLVALLGQPWLFGLGVAPGVAIRRLLIAGVVWGLCVGMEVVRQWVPHQRIRVEQPITPALDVHKGMIASQDEDSTVPTTEEIFTQGIILGVDISRENRT